MATVPKPRVGARKQAHCKQNSTKRPEVDPGKIHLSKGLNEEVEWISSGGRYTLRFEPDASPFHRSEYHVTPSAPVPSGPIREDAAEDKSYKYSITDEKGETTDPEIIIDK